jgi:glycosyltransferase involved in cell wall biosynthesis
MGEKKYVLITAARNEENYLPIAAEALLSQTYRPRAWVIVNDHSTDRTEDVIRSYAQRFSFIQSVHRGQKGAKSNFASKVDALMAGYKQIKDEDYDLIGHLDADISFESDYFQRIIEKFNSNLRLGVAGGYIYEQSRGHFESRHFNTDRSVGGAVQLFRRACYEAVGSFVPFTMGGEDAYAEVMARMKGWEVRSFPELKVFHHRKSTAVRGIFREFFQYGVMDYALGNHPLFEILKAVRRIRERPYVLATFLRMSGFTWSYWRRQKRPVSEEFIRYLRREQMNIVRDRLVFDRLAFASSKKRD